MNRPDYLYTVIDAVENKVVLTDGMPSDVENVTGLSKYHIHRYMNKDIAYRGRYLIVAEEIIKGPKKARLFSSEEKGTMEKFNGAMLYLRIHYRPEQLKRIVITLKNERQTV